MARTSDKMKKLGGSASAVAVAEELVTHPDPAIPVKFTPAGSYSFRVKLPGRLLTHYQEQADAAQKDLEEVLESRLVACIDHTAERGIYFDDDERAALERICDTNFTDSRTAAIHALERLHKAVSVQIEDFNFQDVLTPTDLDRLRSRAEAYSKSLSQYLLECILYGVKAQTGQA